MKKLLSILFTALTASFCLDAISINFLYRNRSFFKNAPEVVKKSNPIIKPSNKQNKEKEQGFFLYNLKKILEKDKQENQHTFDFINKFISQFSKDVKQGVHLDKLQDDLYEKQINLFSFKQILNLQQKETTKKKREALKTIFQECINKNPNNQKDCLGLTIFTSAAKEINHLDRIFNNKIPTDNDEKIFFQEMKNCITQLLQNNYDPQNIIKFVLQESGNPETLNIYKTVMNEATYLAFLINSQNTANENKTDYKQLLASHYCKLVKEKPETREQLKKLFYSLSDVLTGDKETKFIDAIDNNLYEKSKTIKKKLAYPRNYPKVN